MSYVGHWKKVKLCVCGAINELAAAFVLYLVVEDIINKKDNE